MASPALALATGRRRKNDQPSEASARKIWLLLELLRSGFMRFDNYEREHAESFRSFQRDLQHLRTIGKRFGFTISTISKKQVVKLTATDRKLAKLNASRELVNLVADLAKALGEPVALEVGAATDGSMRDADPFLHFSMPRLVEGSRVAQIFEALKDAWSSPRARVQFRYDDARGSSEREVEPYRVTVRAGRYYLVGYDTSRRDWRLFALDRIATKPQRAGTCNVTRNIPERFAGDDVIGFIHGKGQAQPVTVEFTRNMTATAINRQWQKGQVVESLSGGRARITFMVTDPAEVVRWAFGFGADARIVAPPAAVAEARRMAEALAAAHQDSRDYAHAARR